MLFSLVCKTCYPSFLFSALLCELLEVVLALVSGPKVEVIDLIKPFVDQYNLAHFAQILAILSLHI